MKKYLAPILLVLVTSACFGTPLEEQPPDVNLPPYIAAEFVDPTHNVVQVESDQPVRLSIDALFGADPDSSLYYAVIGDRSGIIEQATASPGLADEPYRDVFYRFDGVEIDVEPCSERLRDHDHELIRVHVSDRPFKRVTAAGIDTGDGAFLQTHQWLLRFQPQLCN